MMNRWISISAVTIALMGFSERGMADDWVRYDRPWTYAQLNQAIRFCRLQPRVNPDIGLFVDMVNGRSIDRCMYALGWVGIAR
jgi:hypothetical protein